MKLMRGFKTQEVIEVLEVFAADHKDNDNESVNTSPEEKWLMDSGATVHVMHTKQGMEDI